MDLERFRTLLVARLAELDHIQEAGKESARPVELDQSAVGRLSRMDAMQMQAMAIESERRRRNERLRIESALKRIESGDFGYCHRCDEPVGEKRLLLDPTVLTCIGCADRASGKGSPSEE